MGMAVENEKLIVRGTFHLDEKDLRVTRKKVFSKLRQSRPTRQFFRKNQKSFVEKNFKNEFEVIRKDNFKYRWSFIENEKSESQNSRHFSLKRKRFEDSDGENLIFIVRNHNNNYK